MAIGVCVGAAVGVGVGTGVAVGEPPGDTDGVGVEGGRAGALGQLARAGLNVVGRVVGTIVPDGLALGVGDADVLADELGVAVGAGVGVTTYGVYEGHGGRGGTGGWCAPVMTSEIATAMAPMMTVSTNVIAPHSRRNTVMR